MRNMVLEPRNAVGIMFTVETNDPTNLTKNLSPKGRKIANYRKREAWRACDEDTQTTGTSRRAFLP